MSCASPFPISLNIPIPCVSTQRLCYPVVLHFWSPLYFVCQHGRILFFTLSPFAAPSLLFYPHTPYVFLIFLLFTPKLCSPSFLLLPSYILSFSSIYSLPISTQQRYLHSYPIPLFLYSMLTFPIYSLPTLLLLLPAHGSSAVVYCCHFVGARRAADAVCCGTTKPLMLCRYTSTLVLISLTVKG